MAYLSSLCWSHAICSDKNDHSIYSIFSSWNIQCKDIIWNEWPKLKRCKIKILFNTSQNEAQYKCISRQWGSSLPICAHWTLLQRFYFLIEGLDWNWWKKEILCSLNSTTKQKGVPVCNSTHRRRGLGIKLWKKEISLGQN